MKDLAKHFGSYSSSEPRIIAERKRQNDIFESFVGQKITIKHIGMYDLGSNIGTKQGRITKLTDENGDFERYFFVPKGNKHKGFFITLGLTEGFYTTLTIDEINKGWK